MQRNRWSLLLLAAVVTAACATHPSPNASKTVPTPSSVVALAGSVSVPCRRGATDEQVMTDTLRMVSPTVGWASAQCRLPLSMEDPNCSVGVAVVGVVRTTDGGRHWTDVSPPSVPNRMWSHAETYLDATHAWVAEVTHSSSACVAALTTFSTADGGKTWLQGGTIQLHTGPTDGVFNIAAVNPRWMQFVDPETGWLLVPWWPNVSSDTILQQAALYGTTDGGQTWKFLVLDPGWPAASHARGCASTAYGTQDMRWVSPADGWIEIDCPAITLVHSTDAGAHWTVESLPNCVCVDSQMSFVDPQHGFMAGENLLATADGGASWTQRSLPPGVRWTEFSDATHGRALVLEQQFTTYDVGLYTTTDGGATWARTGPLPVPLTVNPSPLPNQPAVIPPGLWLQSVDEKTAFVVAVPYPGPGVNSGRQLVTLLVETSNGGNSWSTVLSVYANTCQSYGQLDGVPQPQELASASTGWAHGGLRTADGGATWQDMSAPALREGMTTSSYPANYSDFFLGGDHAWQAAAYDSASGCRDHIGTFATADGGRTWTQAASIPITPPATHHFTQLGLDFVSADQGWLWIAYGRDGNAWSAPVDDAEVYGTTDGGAHWHDVSTISLPAGSGCSITGPLTFGSATAGWLQMSCPKPAMIASDDGGLTWHEQNLPFPMAAPTFFDATHAAATIDTGDNVGVTTTTNAGVTWSTHALPGSGCAQFVNCNGSVPTLDLASPNDFWDIVRSLPPKDPNASFDNVALLFHSTDGGMHWALVKTNLHLVGSALNTQITAFLMNGANGMLAVTYTNDAGGARTYQLLTTGDGGRSWTSVAPTVEWRS